MGQVFGGKISVGYKDKKSIMTRMTRKRDRVGLKF